MSAVSALLNRLREVCTDGLLPKSKNPQAQIVHLELDEFNECPGRIEVPVMIQGLDLCHTPAESFKGLKRVTSYDCLSQLASPATVTDDLIGAASRDPTLSQPNSATSSLQEPDFLVSSRQSSTSDFGVRLSPRIPSPRRDGSVSPPSSSRSPSLDHSVDKIMAFDGLKLKALSPIRTRLDPELAGAQNVQPLGSGPGSCSPGAPHAVRRVAGSPVTDQMPFRQLPAVPGVAVPQEQGREGITMRPIRAHSRTSSWHLPNSTCNPYDLSSNQRSIAQSISELKAIRPARSPPVAPTQPRTAREDMDCIVMIPGIRRDSGPYKRS